MLRQREAVEPASRRFAFGRNWSSFLGKLSPQQIEAAEDSLRTSLAVENLHGLTFLDVGCGSGLSSLAARRLGATVYAFDYDPLCARCTELLREEYFPGDRQWTVTTGSVLDAHFMQSLPQCDIVCAWGVLHHTGAMWQAVEATAAVAPPGGRLLIALYNDQGETSRQWLRVKQTYNRLPRFLRPAYAAAIMAPSEIPFACRPSLLIRPRSYYHEWVRYVRYWRSYYENRGMSRWHDIVDWVGGLPFEVARPDEVQRFLEERGFELVRARLTDGLGCNEFLFQRLRQAGQFEAA